ncbi:hypothetical protein PhaeoP30_01849 [Phaeobacter inhibens]|nr:hypothetical protein PhaeoP30_01849 [Phaeobacter inhibens]
MVRQCSQYLIIGCIVTGLIINEDIAESPVIYIELPSKHFHGVPKLCLW